MLSSMRAPCLGALDPGAQIPWNERSPEELQSTPVQPETSKSQNENRKTQNRGMTGQSVPRVPPKRRALSTMSRPSPRSRWDPPPSRQCLVRGRALRRARVTGPSGPTPARSDLARGGRPGTRFQISNRKQIRDNMGSLNSRPERIPAPHRRPERIPAPHSGHGRTNLNRASDGVKPHRSVKPWRTTFTDGRGPTSPTGAPAPRASHGWTSPSRADPGRSLRVGNRVWILPLSRSGGRAPSS